MTRRKNRSGLTLLELMIVLIILVGLIALIGPRLLGSQRKADIKTTQVQIGSLAASLKMFAVDMKTFPSTEEGLSLLMHAPEDERLAQAWDGPYLDGNRLPLDPWGGEFQYEFSAGEGEEFPRIVSSGPDKQLGTSDDIANRDADGELGKDGTARSSSRSSSSANNGR